MDVLFTCIACLICYMVVLVPIFSGKDPMTKALREFLLGLMAGPLFLVLLGLLMWGFAYAFGIKG